MYKTCLPGHRLKVKQCRDGREDYENVINANFTYL